MANTLQYSYLENPMNNMKRQRDRTMKDELSRSVGAQYATGDQLRHSSRKNEETEPKLLCNVVRYCPKFLVWEDGDHEPL